MSDGARPGADPADAGVRAALASFVHRWVPGVAPVTLLLLHGTGGNEDDLLPLGPRLAPGASLLSPRGPVLENGMPRFFRRIAEGVFDVPDLLRRTDDLAAFVSAAAEAYRFDLARTVAAGFSNGANIAGSLLLRHPGLLAGAVLIRPMVPFRPEPAPALAGTRVLIAAGRTDPIAPPVQARTLADLLQQAGAEVTLAWSPGGHTIGPDDLGTAREWMDEHFGLDAAG